MTKFLSLILCLFLLFNFGFGGNILLFYPLQAKSHLYSFLPFLQQLGSDGHNITVFFVDNAPPAHFGNNISTITTIINKPAINNKDMSKMSWETVSHGFTIPLVTYMFQKNYNELLEISSDKYTEAISGNYDFILVDEIFALHGIAGATMLKKFGNIPYAIYSSSGQTNHYQSVGAWSRNYVATPSMFTPIPLSNEDIYRPTYFFQRFINFVENYSQVFLMNNILPWLIEFHFPKVDINSFFQNSYLTFGEHIDRLDNILTISSDLALVGSHCESASKSIDSNLSKEWKDFVEDPTSKGTIYIAFGTNIRWEGAPEYAVNAFVDAINELDEYRIVFSWNGEYPKNVKSHVKFTKWAPQMALLSHSKTKLFVTHGGLKSLKESLCAEMPVILMPMFAEQAHNAKFGLKLGIGGILNKFKLTKNMIVQAIRKIVANETFHKRVKTLKQILLDREISPMKFGSHKLGKLIRMRSKFGSHIYDSAHKELLKRKGIFLNNFEFFHFDWMVAVFALAFIISK